MFKIAAAPRFFPSDTDDIYHDDGILFCLFVNEIFDGFLYRRLVFGIVAVAPDVDLRGAADDDLTDIRRIIGIFGHDETAVDDFGFAQKFAAALGNAGGDDEDAVFGQALSVLHHFAVFPVFQASAVHETRAGRNAFAELHGFPRQFDAVADPADEHIVFAHAQIRRQLHVAFEMAVFPVHGNKEFGL